MSQRKRLTWYTNQFKKQNASYLPLLIRNFCSIDTGAQYIKVHSTPKPNVTNPSKGKDGLSKFSLSATIFGKGTFVLAKSTPGNVLRNSGTPMSYIKCGENH